jgi:hypothetical protein
MKRLALENLAKEQTRLLSLGEERRVGKLDGSFFTLEDIRREIENNTEEGLKQAQIWYRSEKLLDKLYR